MLNYSSDSVSEWLGCCELAMSCNNASHLLATWGTLKRLKQLSYALRLSFIPLEARLSIVGSHEEAQHSEPIWTKNKYSIRKELQSNENDVGRIRHAMVYQEARR